MRAIYSIVTIGFFAAAALAWSGWVAAPRAGETVVTDGHLASLEIPCVRDHTCTPVRHGQGGLLLAVGAECPVCPNCKPEDKKYCSDQTPYCCPAVSGSPYCAVDVNGCTR